MSELKKSLRDVARALAPEATLRIYRRRRLRSRASELVASSSPGDSLSALCASLWRYPEFRPFQVVSEAERLFELVRNRQVRTILEIGAARGGTTYLFARTARADARIVTLDLQFHDGWPEAIRQFASAGQSVIVIEADSHASRTVDLVAHELGGASIDVLFIDGDHSFDGVKRDFELYSPLVARGGLVVFHDIVEDSLTRTGVQTDTYVGGVPAFWRWIKSEYGAVHEIVEDADQDGYGIGVLEWGAEG